ncbi:MAG TPA: CDP-alcohol phosphatidyltransferase family protein [Actinomycetota bacterium]|nr:CDP-alcohol phosphatidyltransferase family protein [Actinomycetota bacterium]
MPAWVADALTFARVLLAPVLAVVLARGRLAPAAVVLSVAWLTDFADGRVARAGRGRTRLGGFDLPADTLVGAGVLVGLAADGYIPAPVAAAVLLVLGGGFLVLRNEALSMALQAVGYGGFLWRLWIQRSAFMWFPVLTIAAIAVLDRRRFTRIVLPGFLDGVRSALALRRGSGFRLPSDEP